MPKESQTLKVDLTAKGTLLAGLRGSGKTNFARTLCALHPEEVLVYDPLGQYEEYDRIVPKHLDYPKAGEELANILNRLDLWKKEATYRLLVIDEAQRVVPNSRSLHPTLSRLNSEHRHIPLGIVWITRRPRELHPEIVNLADHIMIWRLPGATDARFLDDTAKGLAEAVGGLKERFSFVYTNQDRRFWTCKPVPEA